MKCYHPIRKVLDVWNKGTTGFLMPSYPNLRKVIIYQNRNNKKCKIKSLFILLKIITLLFFGNYFCTYQKPNHTDKSKETFYFKIAVTMLSRNINVDSLLNENWTIAHIATAYSSPEITMQVLQSTDYLNIKNSDGFTPLALSGNNKYSDTIRNMILLINKKEIRDLSDTTIQWLVDNSFEHTQLNIINENDYTPLQAALLQNNPEIVIDLIQSGANVANPHLNEHLHLHLILKWNIFGAEEIEIILLLLLNNGSDVNSRDNYGNTPLHYAILDQPSKTIILLLNAGADVNAININGSNPLHLLMESENNIRKSEIIQLLLDKNIDINTINYAGFSPLHICASSGSEEIMKKFLDKNAEINIQNSNGVTPLHIAANNNRIDIVSLLLTKGARINLTTDINETPLHWAILGENVNSTEFLIISGADINFKNVYGNTPLHLAVQSQNILLVELLLKYGAVTSIENNIGFKPIDIADKYKYSGGNWNQISELLQYYNEQN